MLSYLTGYDVKGFSSHFFLNIISRIAQWWPLVTRRRTAIKGIAAKNSPHIVTSTYNFLSSVEHNAECYGLTRITHHSLSLHLFHTKVNDNKTVTYCCYLKEVIRLIWMNKLSLDELSLNGKLKGNVHPKMKILASFTHPQVVPNLYLLQLFNTK